MIVCRDVSKSYRSRRVLGPVSLTVETGENVAIVGPSGAGKTTLLHCVAGLESPDSGQVTFFGHDWQALSDSRQRGMRLRQLGLLFQSPDLLSELTLLQNVSLPLEFSGHSLRDAEARAADILDRVGLSSVSSHRPNQVSGGEAQRAALARALVMRPAAVLADEPTGSLDSGTRDTVLAVLTDLTRDAGATLIVVTHDPIVAAALDRTVTLVDGVVVDGVVGDLVDAG